MPTLHALLIGIDKYHPDSEVTPLDGCINDVTEVEQFLKKHYADLIKEDSILKLENDSATRTGIIKAFDSHLIKKAKVDDIVLFYYAGHGSHNESLDVFKHLDGKAQDETFVCYDSRLEGHYDLADKEIAVLLSRIADGVDIVVIADSCHSASITRSFLPSVKNRNCKPSEGIRPLKSYLLENDNFYETMLADEDKIKIPSSKHLVISACDRDEEAQETPDARGLFTTYLLQVLAENTDVSYANLFDETREAVFVESAEEQRPFLQAWNGFNPNTVFLRSKVLPNTRYLIKYEAGKWIMEYGAIYGLPSKSELAKKITIGVYESNAEGTKFITQAKVKAVNLGTTVLAEGLPLNQNKNYWGQIQNFPTTLVVNLKGSSTDIKNFNRFYNKSSSALFRLKQNGLSGKYTLFVSANKLSIYEQEPKREIDSINEITEESVQLIIKQLEHIAKWETTSNLSNDNENTQLKNDIEFVFSEENDNGELEELNGKNITLTYGDGSNKDDPRPRWYQIKARNVSNEPLFVSLLHLSPSFEIKAHFQSQVLPKKSEWKILDESHGLVIDKEEWCQVTDIFKIIVSNKPFDEKKYLLPELRAITTRGTISKKTYAKKSKEDWFAHTLTVTLMRYETKIGDSLITLSDNVITFKAHETFRADLALGLAQKHKGRGVSYWHKLRQRVKMIGAEIFPLDGSATEEAAQNIFEFSNIENEEVLKQQPLELIINKSIEKGETLIPVTFDGEFIIPVGISEKQSNGHTELRVNNLSTATYSNRKKKKRGFIRAGWFCLLKLTGFGDSHFFKLRQVHYLQGKPVQLEINSKHIQKANKILVVIHGIIGDTKTIIKNLEFLQREEKYDLILTFDYENLNTKIEEIAKKLHQNLEKYGLHADDGKQLDILAHSMGGLVSRYMIEYIRKGDNFVNRLFMFGTPNGGSIFGEVPIFRNRLIVLLTLGLNYGSAWFGQVGVILNGLNQFLISTQPLTITLAQMSSKSDFIDKITNSTRNGNTQYTVIAGDISDYKTLNDTYLNKLMEKVLLKIGDVANNEANDIAVTVDNIRAVPQEMKPLKYDVCCHHMNYFEEGEGLRILKEVIEG